MPVYVVSYDLKQGSGSHDYADLYAALDKLKSHRVLLSVFLVSTPQNSRALFDHLSGFMDPKDRLWISRMPPRTKIDYSFKAMSGTNDWLKKHPPS